jgi:putative DNA primase/helicase
MKKGDANDILRELGPEGVVRAFDATEEIRLRARGNGAEKPSKQIQITMGADIKPRAIDWLWPDWLAHGKLHVLAGRPGTLKTTAVLSFAATITIGGQWPDRSRATLGKVVMWSGEDAIDDTLLPRFLAAGGDPAKIGFVGGVEENGKIRGFDPAHDMEELVTKCVDHGQICLVLIDPIVAVAKGDSHKNAEARRDLQPLVDLAERTSAAVLGVHHMTKRSEGADPVDRVSGSLAFGAGPRVVMLSALESKAAGEARGVLMRAKSNIGPSHGGFEFRSDTQPLAAHPDISAQRILWGGWVNESTSDLLTRLEGKAEPPTGTRKAAAFLRDALNGRGPRMAAEVIKEGEGVGLSERALRRALKTLGGWSEKPSMKTGWIWELPEQAS